MLESFLVFAICLSTLFKNSDVVICRGNRRIDVCDKSPRGGKSIPNIHCVCVFIDSSITALAYYESREIDKYDVVC